jgi:replicative DNA helicase
VDLVIVDYLQLMQSGKRSENRVQEISYISRALKGLAREVRVPVIAASQLSRAVESRHPRTPMLSDLRDSGSIEQDADRHVPEPRGDVHDAGTVAQQHPDLPSAYPKGVAQVIVAKHRNGPTGTIELRFRDRLAKFEDWVLRRDDDQ